MRLSLLHKGLLLVSIPLVFELGIFSMLLGLQSEMAREAERINRSRLIGNTVNSIAHNLIVMSNRHEGQTNLALVKRDLKNDLSIILGQFRKLSELTADNPHMHQVVLTCIAQLGDVRKEIALMEKIISSGESVDINQMSSEFHTKFSTIASNLVTSGLLELSSANAHDIDTDTSADIRKRIVFLLKCAAATSALIAIIGATIFSRHLNSRMQVVVTNASRLGRRQPLLEPIAGNDEITDLDRTFHHAADVIQHLEQAREEIIGMVSHDIRSPLNTIRCSSELIEMRLENSLGERDKGLLKTIETNCDRIMRISQDLLDLQKLDAGMLVISKEPTDLKQCFIQAIEATSGLSQSRSINIETSFDSVTANVDAGRIEQLLTNLISNAIKHSEHGGKLLLTLRKAEPGYSAYMSVSDFGKGVPVHLKKTIFDRFSQVDDADAKIGTGLGLAICKAIIELHSGSIGVEDIEPNGSRFWIRLP